jgi:hypothetical protein
MANSEGWDSGGVAKWHFTALLLDEGSLEAALAYFISPFVKRPL